MFANVSVDVGDKQRYLTLPQTAIIYNPYGETVFVVLKKSEADKKRATEAERNAIAEGSRAAAKEAGKAKAALPPDALVVQQTFVTTGATRGDQVAILKGLEEGQKW